MNAALIAIKTPEELSEYMQKNICYGVVSTDRSMHFEEDDDFNKVWQNNGIVQTGEQMAETLCGTCWDQVELERKWFTENGFKVKTFFMWYEIDEENDLPTHTFLAFENENKWVWFENSLGAIIKRFESLDDLVHFVVDEFHKSTKIQKTKSKPHKNMIKVYEYSALNTKMTIDEYISLATNTSYLFRH